MSQNCMPSCSCQGMFWLSGVTVTCTYMQALHPHMCKTTKGQKTAKKNRQREFCSHHNICKRYKAHVQTTFEVMAQVRKLLHKKISQTFNKNSSQRTPCACQWTPLWE